MPIAVEELHISHEGLNIPRMLAEKLTRLSNSSPGGIEQAVKLVQRLAATSEGMQALKEASRVASSHVFQNNLSNLAFLKSRADRSFSIRTDGERATVVFGDGRRGKRLPARTARKIVATYQYGGNKAK